MPTEDFTDVTLASDDTDDKSDHDTVQCVSIRVLLSSQTHNILSPRIGVFYSCTTYILSNSHSSP